MQHEEKRYFHNKGFSTQNVCSAASLRMVAVTGCPSQYKLYMQKTYHGWGKLYTTHFALTIYNLTLQEVLLHEFKSKVIGNKLTQ